MLVSASSRLSVKKLRVAMLRNTIAEQVRGESSGRPVSTFSKVPARKGLLSVFSVAQFLSTFKASE
jgi:hypothetical protein